MAPSRHDEDESTDFGEPVAPPGALPEPPRVPRLPQPLAAPEFEDGDFEGDDPPTTAEPVRDDHHRHIAPRAPSIPTRPVPKFRSDEAFDDDANPTMFDPHVPTGGGPRTVRDPYVPPYMEPVGADRRTADLSTAAQRAMEPTADLGPAARRFLDEQKQKSSGPIPTSREPEPIPEWNAPRDIDAMPRVGGYEPTADVGRVTRPLDDDVPSLARGTPAKDPVRASTRNPSSPTDPVRPSARSAPSPTDPVRPSARNPSSPTGPLRASTRNPPSPTGPMLRPPPAQPRRAPTQPPPIPPRTKAPSSPPASGSGPRTKPSSTGPRPAPLPPVPPLQPAAPPAFVQDRRALGPAPVAPQPFAQPPYAPPAQHPPTVLVDDHARTHRWEGPAVQAQQPPAQPPVPQYPNYPQAQFPPQVAPPPMQAVSHKTPGGIVEPRAQRQLPQVQIRSMADVQKTPPHGMGRLAPPRDPNKARTRRVQDLVIWGSVIVITASIVTLVIWLIAR